MISENLSVLNEFIGNGTAKVFAFTFKTFESANVGAKIRDTSDNSETDIALGVDFSMTAPGFTGGNLTLIDAGQAWIDAEGDLDNGYTIFIYFIPDPKQTVAFADLGRQGTRSIEKVVDRLTMIIKGMSEGIGVIARSFKLPSNVHPTEFDTSLPEGFNSAQGNLLAVNAALNAFEVVQINAAATLDAWLVQSYTPSAIQTLAAGAAAVVGQFERQHIRVKSNGGAKAFSTTPFGVNPALLRDGMEIVVESDSLLDYMTLAENNNNYGYVGNGGIEFKQGTVVSFIYNEPKKRFYIKSLGAW